MFSFRRAEVSEIPALQSIAQATWPETYEPILGKEQVTYMLNLIYSADALKRQFEDGQYFYFIYNNNDIAGFAAFEKIKETTYKLTKLYILPQHQRTGAGKALLDFIIRKVRSLDANILLLNVNRQNRARFFYEKQGFVISEEKDIDIGNGYVMNDYIMQLSIDV